MALWRSLSGSVRMEILSADPSGALSAAQQQGIILENIECIDELTIRFTVQRKYVKEIIRQSHRRGEQSKILGRIGLYWSIFALLHRPVLVTGMIILMVLKAEHTNIL